ncbi:MAG: group 1 truncated hemoglobin [Deltaproteobacteria bacterium]|nr:group 1 truncated hemoglobin [Deltaproteobacteria bacterium]MCB9785784.1 group 1 truncated hemoglobin [Deltaproteobacteria bacterium]
MAESAGDRARSDWELAGGEAVLRPAIAEFVDRMFDDAMIGFMFDGRSRTRIAEMELRLASAQLGGPLRYTGRDIAEVHRRLPIMGGQFARRRQILLNTLRARGVDEGVIERWIAHVDALREHIMGSGAVEHCDHAAQAARLAPRAGTEGSR